MRAAQIVTKCLLDASFLIDLLNEMGENVSARNSHLAAPLQGSNMSDKKLDEVRRVIHALANCWNRHDMAGFAALFAPDAEFVNVVGMWWRGRAEIQAAHELTHSSMFKDSRLNILETRVRFPVEGVALARSLWKLEGHVGPDGLALPPRNGLLFNVLQYSAGTWLIIDAQNTDIIEGVVSRPQ